MIVVFKDREYRVRWSYDKVQIGTHCTINKVIDGNKEQSICAGWSHTSRGDNFNRNIGRKVSLKRALSQLTVTSIFLNEEDWKTHHNFKSAIWEAYRTMTKVPRWGWKTNDIILYLAKKNSLHITHVVHVNDGD